jgi:hypothetical protein
VIAQMGQPWVDETICMLGKHDHVFADVSGLLSRPWDAYNALVSAHQYGVIDKLLFGSDFPYTSATECIETLYSINQLAQGTNLPVVPREALRGIVERDALGLLGSRVTSGGGPPGRLPRCHSARPRTSPRFYIFPRTVRRLGLSHAADGGRDRATDGQGFGDPHPAAARALEDS